jgi:sn-glycerol 3-phosphate transport system ATP-binding protein
MDEPLSNLDAQLRQEMRRELRELQRTLKLTVVYVTHDQAEAMSMADQVVLLSQGRVEQNGEPRALYSKPATTFAARFIGTPPMNLVALEGGRIAGSTVDSGLRDAATLGIRPEDIELDASSPIAADVRSVEYLGADLVLACAIGSQTVLVRTDGQHHASAGERIGLRWAPHDVHAFDAAGHRIQ